MEDNQSKTEEKYGQGYGGKRPLWQWILIYLIIGVIVYGVIYLLFLRSTSPLGY